MTQNLCSPQPVYGPYEQTMFLGCSVLSFSATAGWNGQSSEVNIELVQDTCEMPEGKYKYWYANPNTIYGSRQEFSGPDPGFTYPNIGAPAYFRVADFEYAGIIQGWTIKEDSSGSPVFTVKLTDPRNILENVQIVLDNYEGNTTLGGLYNLLNVYAYLEYTSADCQDAVVGGTGFGSPALGFGGARRTDRGLPWDLIKGAVQDLAGSNAGTPNARYSKGGLFYRGGSGRGWGELNFPNYNNGDAARYIIDLEEVPNSFTWDYRIAGPVVSLAQLIDQVCQDAGCDYYVELLPTQQTLIIKVRTITRTNQPTLGTSTGEITDFIREHNVLLGGHGIINDSFGRELRSEVNSSFVIGAKALQYYEEENQSNIEPFWGWDDDGNAMRWYDSGGLINKQVRIDLRKINLALNNPVTLDLENNAFGWIGENELRWALGDQKTFENMILSLNYPDTVLRRYYKETCGRRVAVDVNPRAAQPGQQGFDIPIGEVAGANGGDPTDPKNMDAATLFNWLSSYASDFYGKQFLVKVPYVCTDVDPDTGDRIFSDEPSTDGGWASILAGGSLTDNNNVLGLPNPSLAADLFKDDSGKFQALLKYTGGASNTEALNLDDYVGNPNTGEVWVKASIDPKWVQNADGDWCALLKLAAPVFDGDAIPGITKNMGSTIVRDPKPLGVLGIDIPFAQNAKKRLGAQETTTGAMSAPSAWPKGAGVPVKSNTRTYGPWYAIGANPGSVHCEVDEGLAPWEYGGIAYMHAAGTAKVYNAATAMQVGERGNVTIPGYPTISLGSALLANPPNWRYDGRTVGMRMHVYPRGPWSYNYTSWALGQETSGASVSSINVTVGTQGVTTSYTITTFTPVFGRFSKGNAERVKQIGLNRLREERERRAASALKKLLKAAENRAMKMVTEPNPQQPASAMMLWAAQLVEEDPKRKVVIGADHNTLGYYSNYSNTSMMSLDGFARPVSNYGDASLPKIATNNDSCLGTQAIAPPPPVSGYTGLPIRQSYLDFLADPVSNTTLLSDDRANSSTSGHDVESVARKSISWLQSNQPSGSNSMMLHLQGSAGGTYADDYRYLATRGPIVMQGWGYDLQGKPVPNASGDSGGSFSTGGGLTDKFKENWLSDAREWPVAPIDLRFDRQRGVWTIPPSFRLYQVQVQGSGGIPAGQDGQATVIKSKDDLYDAQGSGISNPVITVENWSTSSLTSGDKALAYYDTAECKYWLIPAGTGGAGSGTTFGIIDKAYCDYDPAAGYPTGVPPSGHPSGEPYYTGNLPPTGSGGICSPTECLTLGWGLQVKDSGYS